MSTKPTIIVVDDEDGLRTLVSNELSRMGYIVENAADGNQAIALLKRKQFNIAILDIKMPGVDGIEVLKFIHSHCPATKSIMLTGFADLSHAMECMRFGAKDFIDKPFNFQDLVATIERVTNE